MIKVRDVMTSDVVSVQAGTSLKDAARLLIEHGISGVPVVDGERHALGVLSTADLLPKEVAPVRYGRRRERAAFRQADQQSKLEATVVGEAMTSPALTIEASRPVSSAAALMLEYEVARLAVVQEGQLVGIVTRTDLVRAFVRSDADVARDIHGEIVQLRLDDRSLSVVVEDGAVTLRGCVDNGPDAELLTLLVSRVPGVVSVTSSLTWSDTDPEL